MKIWFFSGCNYFDEIFDVIEDPRYVSLIDFLITLYTRCQSVEKTIKTFFFDFTISWIKFFYGKMVINFNILDWLRNLKWEIRKEID